MNNVLLATIARCDRRLLDARLSTVRDVLDGVPSRAIDVMAAVGIRICLLEAGERYRDVSAKLASLEWDVDVDAWLGPPAGLFVIAERTIYARTPNPMMIAHELGHAFDCALGGGDAYFSSSDPEIRCAYDATWQFVTPYAAVGLDEFVAESFRAWIEVNDPTSPWPKVTRPRLRVCSPGMYAWFEHLFALAAIA